jgi:CheY-like chemotaxis protein
MLVVDDSATIRAVVTKALAKDFSMVEASDGEQAWRLLRQDDSIEMVVTDLMMPNLDGYGLINRIRSDQNTLRFASLPIIVVTALADANAKLKALVAGANDFITKNTDALEMQARVLARYKLAQTTAGHHVHHRHVAAEPAATHARANGSVATVAHAHATRTATAAPARPKPVEQSRGALVSRPIAERPTARPSPAMQRVMALHPSLKKASDAAATARAKLEQLGPTTIITLGATALFLVVVGIIFYINRVSPKPTPLPTEVAKIESTSSAESSATATLRAGGDETARVEAPNNSAARSPVTGAAKPTEPVVKPKAETPVPGMMGATRTQTAPAPAKAPEPAAQRATTATAATPRTPEAGAAPAVAAAAGMAAAVVADQATVSPEGQAEQVAAAPASRAIDPAPAAAPKPSPNRITEAELTTLLRKFAFTYEAGDIETFVSLFDNDVRTNDRATKAGLREDYESLFRNSINRQMLLGNVSWEISDKQANGWGNFEVRIKRAGDEEVKTYKGSLTFYVEKIDGRLRIKRMYHGQYRGS